MSLVLLLVMLVKFIVICSPEDDPCDTFHQIDFLSFRNRKIKNERFSVIFTRHGIGGMLLEGLLFQLIVIQHTCNLPS